MSWLTAEKDRIDMNERNRISNAKAGDFVKIDDGDIVTVSIDLSKEPEIVDGDFGKRHSLKTVEPVGKHIDMTEKLFETFVKAVSGKSGIVKVNIGRTGKMKQTRWTVKIV
jgi:hypothetical protein